MYGAFGPQQMYHQTSSPAARRSVPAGRRPGDGGPGSDFAADCEAALHRMENAEIGFPASAWRAAMIDACRLVGYKMTMAKITPKTNRMSANGSFQTSGSCPSRLNHKGKLPIERSSTNTRAKPR